MTAQVVPRRSNNAEYVDAPVGLEAFVFNREDGLAEDGGKVVGADRQSGVECPDYVILARAFGCGVL